MAKRSIYKILLPAMRFLAMIHAFVGLLIYEETDGHFVGNHQQGGEYNLLSANNSREQALIPRLFNFKSWKKAEPEKMERFNEMLEEELPESSVFHLALLGELEKRRKKKVVRTPFGEFTIKELFAPFHSLNCLQS